jgi:asparagine synthase (glutamine-hydrolysing)
MDHYVEQLVDLTDPAANQIFNMTVEDARERILRGTPESVREIAGSFALVARSGKMVRLARSLDRPMRYFLAKRAEGPALIVADRIDVIHKWLQAEGFADHT